MFRLRSAFSPLGVSRSILHRRLYCGKLHKNEPMDVEILRLRIDNSELENFAAELIQDNNTLRKDIIVLRGENDTLRKENNVLSEKISDRDEHSAAFEVLGMITWALLSLTAIVCIVIGIVIVVVHILYYLLGALLG